jgi:signal peptidase I
MTTIAAALSLLPPEVAEEIKYDLDDEGQKWTLCIGASMQPTILEWDGTLDRWHLPWKIERGRVVVFIRPGTPYKAGNIFYQFHCKRVTGVPGDVIDGVEIPADEYYVTGDNPSGSYDSGQYGSIPRRNVVAQVVAIKSHITGEVTWLHDDAGPPRQSRP